MTQHTPGPWIMEHAQDVVTDTQHRIVAIAYDPQDQRSISEISNANARLICAAPDLLEALKIARRTIMGINPGAWGVMDKLDSAIAKAEGQA